MGPLTPGRHQTQRPASPPPPSGCMDGVAAWPLGPMRQSVRPGSPRVNTPLLNVQPRGSQTVGNHQIDTAHAPSQAAMRTPPPPSWALAPRPAGPWMSGTPARPAHCCPPSQGIWLLRGRGVYDSSTGEPLVPGRTWQPPTDVQKHSDGPRHRVAAIVGPPWFPSRSKKVQALTHHANCSHTNNGGGGVPTPTPWSLTPGDSDPDSGPVAPAHVGTHTSDLNAWAA